MARGDMKWFVQGLHDLGNKIHDMDGDDWRLGIVTNVTIPAVTTAAPHWGGTGTTNFATTQVGVGGGYTGPVVLTGEAWAVSGSATIFGADAVSLTQNASGFTDGYWGIIYNNTDVNKRAVGYLDLGGPVSLVAGNVTITFNSDATSGDALKITQA